MTTWFTSDLHLNHASMVRSDGTKTGIMEYCPESRPFNGDVETMNDAIIKAFHSRVGIDDTVYILGDLCMGPRDQHESLVRRLTLDGLLDVRLVAGNHDEEKKHPALIAGGIRGIYENIIVEAAGKRFWLNHYPIDNSADGRGYTRPEAPGVYDIALCGHVHNLWKYRAGCINVGIDVWDLHPVSAEELIEFYQNTPALRGYVRGLG